MVTLAFGYPLLKARVLEFLARNHRYGNCPFAVDDLGEAMLGAFMRFVGLTAVASFAGIFVAAAAFKTVGLVYAHRYGHVPHMIGYSTVQIYVLGVYRGWTTNAFWRSIRVGDVEIRSRLNPWRLGVIYISNAFAILASLGFATPWAVVRTYRYRIESLEITGSAAIEAGSDRGAPEGLVGAAADDGFALDVGL